MTCERITSRKNATLLRAASLHDKKGRDANRCFMAEGEKLTYEALRLGLPVTEIFVCETKADGLLDRLAPYLQHPEHRAVRVFLLTEECFVKISTEKAPQGIVTVIKYLDIFKSCNTIYKDDFSLAQDEKAVILYDLQDPGNLGTIIRSAAAFGFGTVFLCGNCADVYHPRVVRASMASLFRVRVIAVGDPRSLIGYLHDRKRRIRAAELRENAEPIGSAGLQGNDVIVIGNEGHGIPPAFSAQCDGSVYIPITEGAESLNAAAAAAVLLWTVSSLG